MKKTQTIAYFSTIIYFLLLVPGHFVFSQSIACDGVKGGTATLDACGICVGGTTGLKPCKTLSNGSYYIKALNSGLCVEDATSVTQQNCTSKTAQLWKVTKTGNFYQIQNSASNKYLSVAPTPSSYVFSTFKGDRDPGMKLSIYTSKDAQNFTLLSDTGFEGTSSNLRDPSIMRHTDGKYYVAYTNAPGESCCGKQDHFSIASSKDLITWTNVTTVSATAITGVAHTWAPEWFIDGNTVKIIASIDTQNNDSDFKPYIFTALNNSLTSWTAPVAMGFGPNYIDSFVIKVGATYHCFTKNETTRYSEHATSASLTGPWKFLTNGNTNIWGAGMEGPNIVKMENGTYRIFIDGQGPPFIYADSQDLLTWTGYKAVPDISAIVRHGTIINLAAAPPLSGTTIVTSAASTLWRLEDAGNEAFTLVPATNFMLAADVTGSSALAGKGLDIYTRNNKDNQKFAFSTSLVTSIEKTQEAISTGCYPNPFINELQISATGTFNYVIYDLSGSPVESGSGLENTFAGKSLQSGVYMLKIHSEQGTKTEKISKY